MFKRRKTDDPPLSAVPTSAAVLPLRPATQPSPDRIQDEPTAPEPAASTPEQPVTPAAPGPSPAAAALPDTGLGVPPYRPQPYRPDGPKEPTQMARPPFTTSPSQSNQPLGMMPANRAMNPNPSPPPASSSIVSPPPAPAPVATPEAATRRTLVVGRGISLQGTVQDAERLVVDGTVEASMIRATELFVSPGGMFKGEIEVEDAEVAGTVDGTVTARGSLIVRASGKVLGTAHCRRLQVEDGGQITGRIEMITEAAPVLRPVEAH